MPLRGWWPLATVGRPELCPEHTHNPQERFPVASFGLARPASAPMFPRYATTDKATDGRHGSLGWIRAVLTGS